MRKRLPKTVGIWIRVSTEDQAQGESPAHHEKRARLYAEAKGWKVATVYDLSGVSGKTVWEHPETKRMLKDIEAGAVSGLIFSKLARLARNTKELLDFAERFREHDADLISLQESIDTSSPAGRLFYTMIAAMAQWEREEIAERVAASVPIRAKLGKNVGGQASFGYRWQDGQLVPDPEEAPVRKLLYDLFLEHRRKRTVAKILNERGYRTRSGAKWSDTTVTRLLRDPTAKGLHRANYTRSQGRGKRAVLKAETEWVLRDVPAIVSKEKWDAAQALLNSQREGWTRGRPAERLFGGLLRCECGKKMYMKPPSPKYVCRSCGRRIAADDLEEIFRSELHSFFLSDEEIRSFLEKEDADIAGKEEQIRILEAERRKCVSEAEKLYLEFTNDDLPARSFGELHGRLTEREVAIGDEVAKLRAEIDVHRINLLSREEVVSGARDLYSRWGSLSFEEKRAIVETIVEEIIIGETIEINLAYIPGNAANNATHQQGFIAATSKMRAG